MGISISMVKLRLPLDDLEAAHDRFVTSSLLLIVRKLKELQSSKIGGEQAFACIPYSSAVEAARQELRRLKNHDSCLALCRAVSLNPVWSIRIFNELQGSKIGGEQALACSPYFSMLEAALRELLPLQYLDSGLALCRPVSENSARPSRKKRSSRAPNLAENKPSLVLHISAWWRQLFESCFPSNTPIQALRFAGLFRITQRGPAAEKRSSRAPNLAENKPSLVLHISAWWRQLFESCFPSNTSIQALRFAGLFRITQRGPAAEKRSSRAPKLAENKPLLVLHISAWWRQLFESCFPSNTPIQALRFAGLFCCIWYGLSGPSMSSRALKLAENKLVLVLQVLAWWRRLVKSCPDSVTTIQALLFAGLFQIIRCGPPAI